MQNLFKSYMFKKLYVATGLGRPGYQLARNILKDELREDGLRLKPAGSSHPAKFSTAAGFFKKLSAVLSNNNTVTCAKIKLIKSHGS